MTTRTGIETVLTEDGAAAAIPAASGRAADERHIRNESSVD